MTCPALAAATAHDATRRVPVAMAGRRVGSVAKAHLPLLRRFPALVRIEAQGVTLPAADPTAALDELNAALREHGAIPGWRDERFTVFDPVTREALGHLERAAARFWGLLTLGAHLNGYVADAGGRPAQLWIARRSLAKATDPGLYDNLVGGGVPAGQSPAETLVREGFEEAGLVSAQMAQAVPAGVLRLHRDIPEGLQHEHLHAWDLAVPRGVTPANQDGEVEGFTLLPVAQALQLAAGSTMTVDAAVVTLHFGLRHGFVDDAALAAGVRRLQSPA